MIATNATATRDLRGTCGHAIKSGERLRMFRERALSMAEARNAGTMYPTRKWCAACVARKAAVFAKQAEVAS